MLVAFAQSRAMLEKPMSFPPIWTVTMLVCFASESNCGGLGPSNVFPRVIMRPLFPGPEPR